MKVKFIFDTDNENDAEDLRTFQRAKDMRYVITGFVTDRRYKHADKSEEWEKGFDDAYQIFFELCNAVDLNAGDL